MIFFVAFFYLVFAAASGIVGSDRKIGFWVPFFVSIVMTPLMGFIAALTSPVKDQPIKKK